MIRLFILSLISISLFGAEVENFRWENGVTYSDYLEKNSLPRKHLLDNLDTDDRRLVEEIRAGFHCHLTRDKNGVIEQVLIPLNDELQLHIYKKNGQYTFEAIPIIYELKTSAFTLKTRLNPSVDIKKETNSIKLVSIFNSAFGVSVDFTALRKDDNLVMIYEQKYRLGKPFSMPTFKAGMVETNKRPHYIYLNTDGRYYDAKGKQIESFLLARPIRGGRISSRFTKRRFHPILRKWKAHLGIDYAAPRGTPIVSAGNGRISHLGRLGSYGKLIKIRHKDGFETRYAHMRSYRKGMRRGKSVKKGQTIGYVGTTGRSTGPHLHFELRKNGRAINPAKRVQLTTKKLRNKEKKAFIKLSKDYNEVLHAHLEEQTKFVIPQKRNKVCYFNNDNKPAQVCVDE